MSEYAQNAANADFARAAAELSDAAYKIHAAAAQALLPPKCKCMSEPQTGAANQVCA